MTGRIDRPCAAIAAIAVWGAIAVATSNLQGCARRESDPPPTRFTLATGSAGSQHDRLGQALAASLSSTVDNAIISPRRTSGSVLNIEAIQERSADFAIVQADIAYLAYKQKTDTHRTRPRGVAVLFVNAVQILVRSDADIRTVVEFRGRRIAVGSSGSPTAVAAHAIFESYGLRDTDVTLQPIDDEIYPDDRVSKIQSRAVDVGIFQNHPVVGDTAKIAGLRLIELQHPQISMIRSRYPFYKLVTVPQGTYPDQDHDVQTIGTDTLLVCREDLPEDQVYQLTRAFFESLSKLKQSQPLAKLIDPELGPTSSIPLHQGAARFYRERELKR